MRDQNIQNLQNKENYVDERTQILNAAKARHAMNEANIRLQMKEARPKIVDGI